ncbi:MAG: photosystem II oxygen evolving complex protein PsbP [Leptolyngbya sp. SIO4C1]|nr:photosystem II oxygen evolving complex protein PsbP [Leptolyngbya sp. SIO4C1]
MLRRLAAVLLVAIAALSLQGCISAGSGLKSYANTYQGYQFMYPTGWVEIKAGEGPDVVFHDIIEPTDNVSVVISPVAEGKTLADLGGPTEVGYKLSKSITAMTDSDRNVELVNAQAIDADEGKTYYILEYVADLPSGVRHNLASAIVRRGQLYTFNASVPEARWEKVEDLLKQSVASFSVY